MIGEVIGNYRVIAELGRGGMGVIYRAEHVHLGRLAALKMLLPQLSSDPSVVQRFFNEARAASAIDHPGIVEIYDFGSHTDGAAYLVMELLQGESLEHRLRRGPLPPLDAATLVAQAAAALAAAHGRGIVHRDLKPDNLFLVPNELVPGGIQVKLLDFGIAKLTFRTPADHMTRTGALIGTPAYMSPEQCMGRSDLDHRTDIYAVGCILFHLFCGRPPFISSQGTGMMIAAHLRDPVPDPRSLNPQLPAPLAAIALRCLEKDPAARFQSASELRAALIAAGANAPPSRAGAEQYAATLAAPPGAIALPSTVPLGARPAPQGSSSSGHPAGAALASRGPVFPPGGPGYPPSEHAGAPGMASSAPLYPASGPSGGAMASNGPGSPSSSHAGGPAMTTRSGSAGQLVAAAPATPRSRSALAVAGLLVALGGAGVAVGLTRGHDTSRSSTVAESTSGASGAGTSGAGTSAAGNSAAGNSAAGASGAGNSAARNSAAGASGAGASGAGTSGAGTTGTGASSAGASGAGTSGTGASGAGASGAGTSGAGASGAGASGAGASGAGASGAGASGAGASGAGVSGAGASGAATGAAADGAPALEALCPPGQTQRDDTQGHCCWPAQAWSTSAGRCVGAPHCPEGMTVRGEKCVAGTAAGASHASRHPAPPQQPIAGAPSFGLDAASYSPGEPIGIRFTTAVSSTPRSRAWITVVEAGQPPSAYGEWGYLEDAATAATLRAPDKPGSYEVRLHTDYPAQTFHVVHAVRIAVAAPAAIAGEPTVTPRAQQRFSLAARTAHPGASVVLTFATALHAAPGERFWATIVEAGTADNTWGDYDYVPPDARRMQLAAPAKPGDYEVRLHGNYPTKTTNVLHRVPLRVAE